MLLVIKGKEILLHAYWNGKKMEENKQTNKQKNTKKQKLIILMTDRLGGQ